MNYNTLILILTLCSLNSFTSSLNAVQPRFEDFSQKTEKEHQFLPRNRKINLSAPAPKDSFLRLPINQSLLLDIAADKNNTDCAIVRAYFNQREKIRSLEDTREKKPVFPWKKLVNTIALKKAQNDFEVMFPAFDTALSNLITNQPKGYKEQILTELTWLKNNIDSIVQ